MTEFMPVGFISLSEAIERARDAWFAHEMEATAPTPEEVEYFRLKKDDLAHEENRALEVAFLAKPKKRELFLDQTYEKMRPILFSEGLQVILLRENGTMLTVPVGFWGSRKAKNSRLYHNALNIR